MGMGIVSSKHHRGTGLLWDGPDIFAHRIVSLCGEVSPGKKRKNLLQCKAIDA